MKYTNGRKNQISIDYQGYYEHLNEILAREEGAEGVARVEKKNFLQFCSLEMTE